VEWARYGIEVAGLLVAGGLVTRWLDRRMRSIEQEKAEADLEAGARDQTQVWYRRWQEEVDARLADREAHRMGIEKLQAESAEKAASCEERIAAIQAALAEEVKKRQALERKVVRLENQIRSLGHIPEPT